MAENPTVRLAEALISPLDANVKLKTRSTVIAERRKTVDDLRKMEGEVSNKTRLEKIRERTMGGKSFDPKEADGLRPSFGLGEATLDKVTGLLTPPTEPDAKALHEAGVRALKTVTDVVLYSSITDEAVRTGKTVEQVLLEKTGRTDWIDIKTSALDALVADETIAEIFEDSDLSTLKPLAIRDLIDQALARQPDFRNKIIETYQSAEESLKLLPEIDRDEEYVKAEKAKTEGKKIIDEAVVRVLAVATNLGITGIDQAWIEDAIKRGLSPETIHRQIYEKAIAEKGIDLVKIQAHFNHDAIRAKIREIDGQLLIVPKGGFNPTIEARLVAEQARLQQTIDDSVTWAGTPEGMAQIKDFTQIQSTLHDGKDAGGVYQTEYMRDLQSATLAHTTVQSSEQIMSDREKVDQNLQKTSRAERARKESEIISQLENAIGTAALDVIEDRYDELLPLATSKADKERSETESDDERSITESMRDNWISYDANSRRTLVDRHLIAADMRLIIYHGEDGIRRLIAHELGLIPARANVGNFDMDKLSDADKARLDKVVESKGEAFREKLMTDYFLARNRRLIFRKGVDTFGAVSDLKLLPHEWELLQRNFGDKIDAALKSSKEAQTITKNLEKSGIKPHFKTKYLLYILCGLGLLGGGIFGAGKL